MDIDIDSDEDTEIQLKDVEELTKVLEADETSGSMASCSSLTSPATSCLLSSPMKVEEYSRIETALALNKLTDMKLQRLEQVLDNRLRQCRQRLADLQNMDISTTKKEKFHYVNCGKPYFKDSNNFLAPDNHDTIVMNKSDMYDFSRVGSVPGWTVKDKSDFITSILEMSKEIRSKELDSKIAEIRRDSNKSESVKKIEIEALNREQSKVDKKSLSDLALPLHEEYDWDTIANKLNRRHSAQEYRSLWKLFLHPLINKDCWTKSEHTLLQQLAQNNMQDWDHIAEQLNTNRSGYQCFVYYRTNMSNTLTGSKWSREEEEYLKRLIEYYKEDNYIPWGRVTAAMENRTKIQIYNKYMRLIEYRKGRFLPEEDAVILNCVAQFGKNFRKIANFLPGRSQCQLRNRHSVLTKRTLSTVWTASEDKQLIQLMANQDKLVNYSGLCKYFPGKDRVNIRARYVTLLRWMKRNPNVDLARAPRRGARRLCHGQATTSINKAVEKLKNRMQTELQTKKKSKKITKDSKEKDIEESIVAHLVTEQIKKEDLDHEFGNKGLLKLDDETSISASKLNTTNLRKILIFLRAALNKAQFNNSSYSDTFPELTNPEQEVCLVKVKSYSRKEMINTIKVDKLPTLWGDITLGPTEYVLPPHFATMTGCRALIAHITARSLPKLDINLLKARNVIFRDQLYLLMERFNNMFLWPMLLSNEAPNKPRRLSYLRKGRELYPEIPPLTASIEDLQDGEVPARKADKKTKLRSTAKQKNKK